MKNKSRFILSCVASSFALAFAIQAHAADARLTEDMVKRYYAASEQVHLRPYADYVAFTNQHTADDVQVILNSEVTIQGSPTQKEQSTLDKKKVMESLKEEYDAAQSSKISHTLKGIKISPDGKSATAVDLTLIESDSLAPKSENNMPLHVTSQSACEDQLVLAGANIQLKKSTCQTKTQITPLSNDQPQTQNPAQ